MALATDPTYTTLAEFKANSPVSGHDSIVEGDWKPFALRAERIIDNYTLVPREKRYTFAQLRNFPICDYDGNSWIPEDVKIAHIELTANLILEGAQTEAYADTEVLSENWSGSGYSKTKAKKSTSPSAKYEFQLPPLVRRLLRPWSLNNARLTY